MSEPSLVNVMRKFTRSGGGGRLQSRPATTIPLRGDHKKPTAMSKSSLVWFESLVHSPSYFHCLMCAFGWRLNGKIITRVCSRILRTLHIQEIRKRNHSWILCLVWGVTDKNSPKLSNGIDAILVVC